MRQNFLKLNNEKTELMIFGSPSSLRKLGHISIKVGDQTINTSTTIRNLGVYYDPSLKMETHVNSIVRGTNMYLYNLARVRKYLTTSTTQTLVHAFITSRLDYANSLLYGIPKKTIKKLQRVQNNAARLVARTPRRDHITPILRELHWLPIQKRIDFKVLNLTYKALHGEAPAYLQQLITPYTPCRDLRSKDQLRLTCKRFKTKYGHRSFVAASAKLWNPLPEEIKRKPTQQSFRKALKTHFFDMKL